MIIRNGQLTIFLMGMASLGKTAPAAPDIFCWWHKNRRLHRLYLNLDNRRPTHQLRLNQPPCSREGTGVLVGRGFLFCSVVSTLCCVLFCSHPVRSVAGLAYVLVCCDIDRLS